MFRRRLLLAVLALLVAPTAHGANILLVIDDTTPDSDEQDRITTFESWGHTVTTIRDGESQATYDAAVADVDVVYVPETVFSSAVGDKVRDVTASVIVEESGIQDDMGFSTSSGSSNSRTTIRITDNSHAITTGFPVGLLTITTSSNSLNRLVNDQALGVQPLADDASVGGEHSVFLMEAGVTLANATNGITLTRGRRVGLPMSTGFNWNSLNANGLLIVQRAIDWAAVGNLNFVGGHWQFNETSGTNLQDTSGAGADGTLVNAQHDSNGILGAAVVFAADADDHVALPHTVLDGATDITFATWFRVTDSTSAPTLISAANASNDNDFGVFVQNGNQIVVYEGEGLSQQVWSFGFAIDDDEWRHLTVVRDGTNNQLTLYLDGVSQGTRSATLNPIEVDSGGLILGEDQDFVGGGFDLFQSFDGMLDEVSLYRRVLTAAEIAVLADSDGPIGHWRLDDGSGTIASDSSGNNRAGTLVGNPVWEANGWINGSLRFAADGNDRVELPYTILNEALNVTFATWFRTTPGLDHGGILSAANADNGNELYIAIDNGSQILVFDGEDPNSRELWSVGSRITDGQWRHLAVVRDNSNDEITLYLDGVSQGTRSRSLNSLEVDPGGLLLGEDQDSVGGGFDSTQAFDGSLDEVYLFRDALTAREIAALHGLIGHWRFDETTGATAADSSLSGANLTASPTPTWVTDGARQGAVDLTGTTFNGPGYLDESIGATVGVAGWVRLNTTVADMASSTAEIIDMQRSSVNTGFDLSFRRTEQTLRFRVYDGTGPVNLTWDASALQAGEWLHFAATYDGAEMRLYINGELAASVPNTAGLDIGSVTMMLGDDLDGALDDLVLYSRPLTPEELTKHYGLVGRWRLDETAGTTAADSSPLANDGTYDNGVTLNQPGPYPGEGSIAASLDGTNDQIQVPHHDAYNPDQAVSIALWVRRADVAWWDTLVSKGKLGNPPYILAWTDEGRLTFKADLANVISTGSVPEDEWTHLAVTFDEQEVRFYINGQLDSTHSMVTALTTDSTLELNIGSAEFNTGYAEGDLFDVRLYNRVITHAEIARIYGLVGHWKLDEASGSVAFDSSGLGNDGTYQGSALPGAIGPTLDAPTLAAEFNGVAGDRVALPNVNFDFSRGLSMAIWYRADSLHTTNGSFTDFFSLSNGPLIDDVWLGFNNTSGLDLFISDTVDGEEFRVLLEGSAPLLGVWRHAVAVVDSSGNATIYHDGVAVASGFVSLPQRVSRTDNGIGETSFAYTFDGRLHDARIYNRPLTADEVRTLFFSQFAPGPRILQWVETANP